MSTDFLTTGLLVISVVTNLTVEAIKKLLNGTKVKYSSNILAAVLSVVISLTSCIVYVIMTGIAFTPKICVEIFILMYLGFLVSTMGYDKVMQMIKQIKNVKEDDNNE